MENYDKLQQQLTTQNLDDMASNIPYLIKKEKKKRKRRLCYSEKRWIS